MSKATFNQFFGIFVILIIFSTNLFAQTGKISGKVKDKATGEALIGVSVGIEGTTRGASTDVNGSFNISLPVGKYNLIFRYLGYQNSNIKDVIVTTEKSTSINAIMIEAEIKSLSEVIVTAKSNRESETALNIERKNATIVVQKIGAQELTRKGLSNVSEGVTKIAGISVVGNKNIFVRGLGDRYNNTTLNGLPIPSTNPDLKLIPLDIFPTAVVKNIAVTKSYSPELYGDFSGGSIDIITKDYPERAFFKVGISSGYNSISTGKDFLTTQSDLPGFFGFSRSERKLPSSVSSAEFYNSTNAGNADPRFSTNWSPVNKTAPVNSGFSLSGGNLYRLNNSKELGFLATLNYKNEYKTNEGISAIYNAQQNPGYYYNTSRYTYNTNTSALANIYYKSGSKNSYSLTALYVNDSGNDLFDQDGRHNDLGEIYARRNTYQQNSLFTTQLSSTHDLSERTKLKIAVEYAKTTGGTPDRVQNTLFDLNNNQYSFVRNSTSDNHRFFADLNDNDISGNVSMNIIARDTSKMLKSVQFGFQGRNKQRTFNSRQIDTKIGINGLVDLNNIDAVLNASNLGDGESAGTYRYQESYYAPNNYEADLNIGASYVNFNFDLSRKLKFVVGARGEYSLQNTYYKEGGQTFSSPFKVNSIENFDILPALTLKYGVNSRSNILFAASKTISRPQFVEAAPFRYNEGAALFEKEGNPFLQNSANYNADLKYEIYPTSGELFAVTVFGKYIDKPIELSQVVSADPLFTYINTDQAILGGIELEYNRNIGSMLGVESKTMKNMSFGFNAAYIYSRIKITDATIDNLVNKQRKPVAPTNKERPLFGASPYLINFDYSYKHNWSEESNTMFTLTYNVFGKRLFIAGSQLAGDIYEMPVNTLDFIVNTKINKRIGLDINFGNILNPTFKYQQEFNNNNLSFNEFKRGSTLGLSLNYNF